MTRAEPAGRAGAPPPPADPARAPTRGERAAAVLIDLGVAVVATVAAAASALLYLFVRTGAGAADVGGGDSAVAAALVLAAPAGWLIWQGERARGGRGTVGQARMRLALAPAGARRMRPQARLAAHPLSAIGWLWLAALALVLDAPVAALPAAALAAVWVLLGLAATVAVTRHPGSRPLHDRVAGTRLVRR